MKKILLYGFKYIFKYKTLYFVYFASQILISLSELFIPIMEGAVIDSLVKTDLNIFIKNIIVLILIMLFSLAFSIIGSYLYFLLQVKCGNEANVDEIHNLYSISYKNLLNKDPSVLNQTINNDCNENPDCFVLGVRTYERKKGKKVRFWLNSCQKLFFRITNHGKECPDPRSGLRGFPASLKKLALCTEGKSYDYELNFLDAAIQKTPVVVVPISSETHNINETSHFRPVVDLLGMYLKFWKYLFTSNVATVFDLVFFIIFESLFSKLGTISIFVATICARAISGSVGYILNRYISFQSKLNPEREMVRYSIVFVCQMAANGRISYL